MMEARVVTRITIAASQAEVFTYLTHLRYHPLWNPHLQHIAPLIELTEGARYSATSLMFGIKIPSRVIVAKLVANQALELKSDTQMLQYHVRYQLQAGPGKTTKLTCRTAVSSQSNSFAFARPILKLLAQRELKADLELLKEAVEQQLE